MKLLLSIDNLDHASFKDNDLWDECADIISLAAEKIRSGQTSGYLLDSNGNRVGNWSTSGLNQ